MSDCLRLLLVEDNPADARLLEEALVEAGLHAQLVVVRDGIEALEYLRGNNAVPDVVLLDLNLPRMDGRELLAEIRADPDHCELPVVVLSTSHYDHDIATCRRFGVRGYVIKPTGFDELVGAATRVMRLVEECRNGR